jgi:hypothetical protein
MLRSNRRQGRRGYNILSLLFGCCQFYFKESSLSKLYDLFEVLDAVEAVAIYKMIRGIDYYVDKTRGAVNILIRKYLKILYEPDKMCSSLFVPP